MSINRRDYPPMPAAAWLDPNHEAPDSCYAETPEERALIRKYGERVMQLRTRFPFYGAKKAHAIAQDELRLAELLAEPQA